MTRLLAYLKANKLLVVLLFLVAWLVYQQYVPQVKTRVSLPQTASRGLGGPEVDFGLVPVTDYAPVPEAEERLVVRESSLALLVKNVVETAKSIQQKTQELGGYLVNSQVAHPEEAVAASGSVIVRVPQENLETLLAFCRGLAVKVVSENVSGRDVTDQYVDVQARLQTLTQTKEKLAALLAQATKVDDLLKVQRELINLQQQIDYWQGQAEYLEKSALVSRVTVYLSTDELALPYAPAEAWRPKVIFTQAVRSLVRLVRQAGSALIWLGVYSLVWLPLGLLYLFYRRRHKK